MQGTVGKHCASQQCADTQLLFTSYCRTHKAAGQVNRPRITIQMPMEQRCKHGRNCTNDVKVRCRNICVAAVWGEVSGHSLIVK